MNMTSSKTQSSTHKARVQRPERLQIRWRDASLDQMIPSDHRVRAVWVYVDALDLTPLYEPIKAVQGEPGRDAVDPKILMALWIWSTIEGISSARHIERLCRRDLAYLWICGDVGVNHHLLSDFRKGHGEFLEELLRDTIATLVYQEIVTLETVAQDGMRVRASAGSGSFRRKKTLEQCREAAANQLEALRQERESEESDRSSGSKRQQAARTRAAEERQARVEAALANLTELQDQKEQRKKGSGEQARCSTTDPEARNMKMGDGGFRPAYNVQFATDGDSRMIVAVDVTNNGSDGGQMPSLHEKVCEQYDKVPPQYVVDGGFVTNAAVTAVEQTGSEVYGPMPHAERIERRGGDPHARRAGDSDEMFAFRQRMQSRSAQEILKTRPSIAEYPNAECRNRGLQQFRVRGLEKVKTVCLWYALTFNLMRMWQLKVI